VEAPVFLQTKLHPTQLAARSLHRSRLIRELNRDQDVRLVLVTGPAGSGKSTLMADFLSQRARRTAWLGLGEEDQDPQVFFSYFLESLCQTHKGCCEGTRNRLHTFDLSNPQELCLSLINEIFTYAEPVSILLDDYHLVHSVETIRTFFQTLCRRGPTNLTLFLVTRDIPDLPVDWLRSKRLLCELHYDNLRFSWEETSDLLLDIWGLKLESDLIELIVAKTEGWATAIQLVAQSIRNREPQEIRPLIESLGGGDTAIYNYLASEVFASQPAKVQEFLKVTSVPDVFNADLASELVRGTDVVQMVDYLEKSRLFLVRVERDGVWYRYHHLFGQFLRHRLSLEHGKKAVEALHQQVADWLYHNQQVVASIPHFLSSGDPLLACQILENVGSELLHRGLKNSVSRWIEALPQNLRNGRPGLQVIQSELYDMQGHWPRAVEGYKKALAEYRRRGDDNGVAGVLEKLCLCYVKYGESKLLLDTCEEGLRLCPPEQHAQRAILLCWLGTTLINSGIDWDRGYEVIRNGHVTAFECGDPRAIGWAIPIYGFGYHFPQGNFVEALRTLNEGIDFFTRLDWVLVLYQLIMNKAVVLIIMGQVRSAQQLVDDALIQAKRAGHSFVEKGLEQLRGMAYLELRELEACSDTLSKVSQSEIPAQFKPYFFRSRLLLNCHLQNFEQARVDAEEMSNAMAINGAGLYAPECTLSLAYLLSCTGQQAEALDELNKNLALCIKARAKFWEMKTLQMLAWVHWQRSQPLEMIEALSRSLRLAQLNGYDDYWLCDPLELSIRLLFLAAAHELEKEYTDRLLTSLRDRLSPELEELAQDPDPHLRRVAAQYLSRLPSERNKATLKALYHSDSDEQVRGIIASALRLNEASQLEVRCLGHLRLFRDGEELDYGRLLRPMAVRLLKFFLVQGTKLVPAERIMDSIWPEMEPERARRTLATHLSAVRRALDLTNLFQRVGDAYRLGNPDEISLDLVDYEEAAVAGLDALKNGDGNGALTLLEKAESLYRGDFLEEDLYEEFVEHRRVQLRRLNERVVESLADVHLQQHHYDQAIQRYRRLLSSQEPMEQVFPKLFRCYEALGDRQGIRKEFETLRARLHECLGVEPQDSTRALVESLFKSN
jgi:ATP/maltotriose-dependent transcriptional regulator MalT/DNA-binding SARP family transcriptional activator